MAGRVSERKGQSGFLGEPPALRADRHARLSKYPKDSRLGNRELIGTGLCADRPRLIAGDDLLP